MTVQKRIKLDHPYYFIDFTAEKWNSYKKNDSFHGKNNTEKWTNAYIWGKMTVQKRVKYDSV